MRIQFFLDPLYCYLFAYVFPKGEMKWGHNLEKKQQIAIIKHSEAEGEREEVQQ